MSRIKPTTILIFVLLAIATLQARADQGIGSWRAYMGHGDITRTVKHGNTVYALASGDLFTYNTADQSIATYDKINALSDCGIADIAYSEAARRLVILYSNGNIDLMDDRANVTSLPDYYNKALSVDKTVRRMAVYGTNAYLATAFGAVVVNVANATISDTYQIDGGAHDVALIGTDIYATNGDCTMKASTGDNLADPASWHRLAQGRGYTMLLARGKRLFGAVSGGLYEIDTNTGAYTQLWTPWFTDARITGGEMVFYGGDHTYTYSVDDGSRRDIARQLPGLSADADGSYWAADTDGSLCNIVIADDNTTTNRTTGLRPDGPTRNTFGFMLMHGGQLYTGSGYQATPERKACVQVLGSDGTWTTYDDSFAATLGHNYNNTYAVAVDPANPSHVFMGAQSGLYEFNDSKLTASYNMDNSPLRPANVKEDAQRNYTRVSALTFTADGHLWGFNSEARNDEYSLFEFDGTTWTDHGLGTTFRNSDSRYPTSFNYVKDMFVDSRGLIWFANNNWVTPCFGCYQPSTGGVKLYKSVVNQDGTQYKAWYMTSVAEDLDHNIWIGTDVGPFMLPATQVGTDDETLTQVKIPRNDGTNLADYLLANVNVSCICVDGAGRKWFGTNGNGAYLISSDNITQVEHFTRSNSSLLSDNVEAIAVNDDTGEVFFATENGLCSYMGDATKPADNMTKDNVYAYPNPVRPDYTGLITVTGLTLDADVKITTSNGALVAKGRSNGGTFTWDGRDLKGRRVASGIYMVATATADGGSGTVCKIAVVR